MLAYGLCAQAVGTLAALPLRRSLPALAVAVAVAVALALAVAVAVIMMIVLNRYVERYREDFRPTAGNGKASAGPWQTGSDGCHPPSLAAYRLRTPPEAHAPGSGPGRVVHGCGRPGAVLRYPERHVAVTIGSDGLATLTE